MDQASNDEITGDERADETIDDRARALLTLIGDVSRADEDRLDIIEDIKPGSDDSWKLADIVTWGTADDLRELADGLGASE